MIGTIKIWNPERGFGFVQGLNSRTVFFHIRDWATDEEIPAVGQTVEYEVIHDLKRDKKKAVNMRLHPATNVPHVSADGKAGVDALAGGDALLKTGDQ
jgi:cold shock CspA family protein